MQLTHAPILLALVASALARPLVVRESGRPLVVRESGPPPPPPPTHDNQTASASHGGGHQGGASCETQTAAKQAECIEACQGGSACIVGCTATAVNGYVGCGE